MQFGEWRRRLLVGIGVGGLITVCLLRRLRSSPAPDDIIAATGAMTFGSEGPGQLDRILSR
jgi:hypothetical protein